MTARGDDRGYREDGYARDPDPDRDHWAGRLLARFLRANEGHALGDLDEEYRERVRPARSRVSAEWWYLREATSLVGGILRDRVGRRTQERRSNSNANGEGTMRGVLRDARGAVRSLLRSPGYALVIAGTLTVAIGATTMTFSVANAAFLRPLPYPDAERLVSVYSGNRDDPEAVTAVSPLDWRDFAGFEQVVEASAVWSLGETVHMTDAGQTRRLIAPRVSSGLFPILGIEPVLGRFFDEADEVPGQDDTVVLSHGLWVAAFGADPDVLDRRIELDGSLFRVIGVAPEGAVLPRDADVWRALALGPEWFEDGRWGWQFLAAVARLSPGTDLDGASRALNERLAVANPDRVTRLGQTRLLRSLYEERSGENGAAILMLLAAVVAVLAMACANIVTVTLVRSESRRREFALRRALGSGAAPLARMAFAETLILAAAGAVGSFALAGFGLRLLAATEMEALATLGPITIDGTVMACGAALTGLIAALIGAAPVLGAVRADPQSALRAGDRGGSAPRATRVRDALVVMQVSMTLTLLVVTGVLAGTFQSLVTSDPGFDEQGVLVARMEFPADAERAGDPSLFYGRLLDRLTALPGVVSAGATNFLPLDGGGWSSSFEVEDPDPSLGEVEPHANMRSVSADYFATVGIRLVEGRAFSDADRLGATPVAIVDETTARRYWPGASPVGQRAIIGGLSREAATIIGVVGDVPDERLDETDAGHVYFPVLQSPQRRMSMVLRTDSDPAALTASVRRAIREVDDRIPVTEVATFESLIADSLLARRIGLLLLSLFGVAAMFLAGIGAYGVLAYTVARRTKEIGTRLALGASPGVILRSVVRQATRLWTLGVVLGAILCWSAITLLTRVASDIETGLAWPYVAAVIALGVTALVSATIPAVRATRVDPVEAMRAE